MIYLLVLVILGGGNAGNHSLRVGNYRSLGSCQAAANEAKGEPTIVRTKITPPRCCSREPAGLRLTTHAIARRGRSWTAHSGCRGRSLRSQSAAHCPKHAIS